LSVMILSSSLCHIYHNTGKTTWSRNAFTQASDSLVQDPPRIVSSAEESVKFYDESIRYYSNSLIKCKEMNFRVDWSRDELQVGEKQNIERSISLRILHEYF